MVIGSTPFDYCERGEFMSEELELMPEEMTSDEYETGVADEYEAGQGPRAGRSRRRRPAGITPVAGGRRRRGVGTDDL
eukprot:1881548-Prymnesium_polylepis.1